ncbi:transcriptional regulator [Weissella oryzae SG25]|uniref:Transcriptional regulator n=2 Tax=Weissella TaxID=46255 RepID=A0A069CWX3_WEIOS|nr:transcriptional regulator [Weissella oryzae SG25]
MQIVHVTFREVDMTTFERIKKISKEQGYSSLRVLSEKAGLGTNAIYQWKNKIPRTDNLQAVADILNVSVDYLLGNTDEKTPQSTKTEESQEIDLDVLTDTDNIKKRLISFGGKPVTEHDAKVISQFLKTYYEGRD